MSISDSDQTLYDSDTTAFESESETETIDNQRQPTLYMCSLDPEVILLRELGPYFVEAMLTHEVDEFYDALFVIWKDHFPAVKDSLDARKVSNTIL